MVNAGSSTRSQHTASVIPHVMRDLSVLAVRLKEILRQVQDDVLIMGVEIARFGPQSHF
jgi:hypothetical protein